MTSTPETVRAVVLNVEDSPVEPGEEPLLERGQGKVAGLVGLARLAWRISALARRPLVAPLALAAPIVRGVVGPGPGSEAGPGVVVRHDGRTISPVEWAALQTGDQARVLVLVPPAGADESIWEEGSAATGATYAERLADLLGWMPLHLGVSAESGPVPAAVALSGLLQECVDALPGTPRVVLVGYADGGLLARNALGVDISGPRPWTAYVSELVALGTTPYAVTSAPVSSGLGRQLDERLAGIAVVAAEEAMLAPRPETDYLLVADGATARPNPVGRLLGEMLWWRHRTPLGSRRVRDLFPTAERFTLATDQTPLSNHPAVHDALLRWLV